MSLPFEVSESDLKMAPYVLKEMVRHLLLKLVLTVTFVELLKKEDRSQYNMTLVMQKERTVIINAMIVGVAFGAAAIWFVLAIKGDEGNLMIVAAGILISLGLMQQILSIAIDAVTVSLTRFLSSWNSVVYTVAKRRTGDKWREVQDETEEIFVFPQVLHTLPAQIRKDSTDESIVTYIYEHRWELAYPQANLKGDENTLLAFSKYATGYIRKRLQAYDRLLTIQHRTGSINPVIFVAVGTLIWLLS